MSSQELLEALKKGVTSIGAEIRGIKPEGWYSVHGPKGVICALYSHKRGQSITIQFPKWIRTHPELRERKGYKWCYFTDLAELPKLLELIKEAMSKEGEEVTRAEPIKVKSAAEATEIALSFLKEHYQFIPQQPIKAAKEDNIWTVEIDVGLLHTRIAKIKIDAKAADILEYSIPPEEI